MWLINVKSRINSGVYDSWLPGNENKVGTNGAYWMSDAGTKETNDCKLFWENGEDVHAFEILGNPAEATDEELLSWAANETNQA